MDKKTLSLVRMDANQHPFICKTFRSATFSLKFFTLIYDRNNLVRMEI